MTCVAQPASTSMVIEVMQLVGVEELAILVVTALLAASFRGAHLGKQFGSSKSPKTSKFKPHHAYQTGSSKSTETLKLKQGAVTLGQSVTHERCQSGQSVTHESCQIGSQGVWGEEPGQNSEQMTPTSSGSSGEELAKPTSQQRWREKRRLLKNASVVSSGDQMKDELVGKIKSLQSSRREMWHAWGVFCDSQEGQKRDPTFYPVDVLQQFVRSSHPWNTRKQPQ